MKHTVTLLFVLLSSLVALAQNHVRTGLRIKQSNSCDTAVVNFYIQPNFDIDSINYLEKVDMDFAIEVVGVNADLLLDRIDTNSFNISPLFDRTDTILPIGPLNTDTIFRISKVDNIVISDPSRNVLAIEFKACALNNYQPLRLNAGQIAGVLSFKIANPINSIGLTMDTVLWSFEDSHLDSLVAINHNERLIAGREEQTLIGCPQAHRNFSLRSSSDKASVYPNPTSGPLTINVERGIHTTQIYNAMGQLVWASDVNGQTQLSLDLSTQNSGPLFLRAFDESMNLVDTQKIIIVK